MSRGFILAIGFEIILRLSTSVYQRPLCGGVSSNFLQVGALKMVSGEAIRILLWILGFLSFGYGTKEFEVTADRLGCYRYVVFY